MLHFVFQFRSRNSNDPRNSKKFLINFNLADILQNDSLKLGTWVNPGANIEAVAVGESRFK